VTASATGAIDKHAPGEFCWAELGTTNQKAAEAFYGALFGWSFENADSTYATVKVNGLEAGALYQLPEEQQKQGVKPHWMLYLSVQDADESSRKATELGGSALMGPLDVMDYGRMALIRDPQGAVFGLWQPKQHIGTRIANVPGTMSWPELVTTDTASAKKFYMGLLKWGEKTSMGGPADAPLEYTEWQLGGRSIGGMIKIAKEWGDVPPHWMPYFLVSDCKATAAKSFELGARVRVPPTPIPDVGEFAIIQDLQGAVFSIIQLSH